MSKLILYEDVSGKTTKQPFTKTSELESILTTILTTELETFDSQTIVDRVKELQEKLIEVEKTLTFLKSSKGLTLETLQPVYKITHKLYDDYTSELETLRTVYDYISSFHETTLTVEQLLLISQTILDGRFKIVKLKDYFDLRHD
jgi:chromosome condensin MukBEF ATPase and DNA-binding subunit MukB